MKKVISTFVLALVLIMCFSLTSLAYSGSIDVELKNTENKVFSAELPCHAAKATAENDPDSNHNVTVALQLSSGTGWSNYGTTTMQPGASANTGVWGRSDTLYLCRVKLWIPGLAANGSMANATMTVTE